MIAQLILQRGLGSAKTALGAVLFADYVNKTDCIGWPESPARSSLDGSGAIVTYTGAAPGAASDAFVNVPAGVRWRLQYAAASMTQSVAGAKRCQVLRVTDAGGVVLYQAGATDGTFPGPYPRTITYDSATHHYKQTVTLRNTSAKPIVGPLSLVLDHLSKRVRLLGLSGRTAARAPAVSPFADVLAGGVLEPGAAVTFTLLFQVPAEAPLRYAVRVLAGRRSVRPHIRTRTSSPASRRNSPRAA